MSHSLIVNDINPKIFLGVGMSRNVLVLKHFEKPPVAGEHHRLLILTGESKGKRLFYQIKSYHNWQRLGG
jgi:hypothetical protein